MPYVEVYVDPEDCDGDCKPAQDAFEKMERALKHLREGDHLGASIILGAAVRDQQTEREMAKEEELRKLYFEWIALETPRPDFLTFAHHQRKASAI